MSLQIKTHFAGEEIKSPRTWEPEKVTSLWGDAGEPGFKFRQADSTAGT